MRNNSKRAIGFLTVFVFSALLASQNVFAYPAIGDVAGDYYYTDIVVIVNGAAIESINIGGMCLLCANDLAYHGFNVVWNEKARTLNISKGGEDFSGGTWTAKSGVVGARIGSYYYTDIVTYLDGKEITTYYTGEKIYI